MLTGEPIIVLGVFRSGTSCLSTCLAKMGVYLGAEEDFYPPNDNNLGGYYEIKVLQELNLRGYGVFGMNFYQADRLPTEWRTTPGSKTFMEEARALVRSKFSGRTSWGWKEPGMTGLIPIYNEVLASENVRPRYAICVRHPLSVSGSQIARQKKWGLEPEPGQLRDLNPPIGEHTLGLWLHYTLSALRDTRGYVREVFSYEDVLTNPARAVDKLAHRVMSNAPSEEQIRDAIASVKPEWSHNKYTFEDLQAWPSIVSRAYDCCLRIDRDSEGFNSGKYDDEVDALWDEFALIGRMIRPIRLPSGQMVVSWKQGNAPPSVMAHKYSPTGSWQTLLLPVNVPAQTIVQLDPYQMPSQIWIRKAAWKTSSGEQRATLSPGPNGVVEDLYGIKRVTVFGPGALYLQGPSGGPSQALEIEFHIQSGQTVMSNIVGMLRGGIDQARRGMQQR
jgi:hypothetical protein